MKGASRLVITGRPGVGKSTLFRKIVDELARIGCGVGGFAAPEVRESGRRIGFLLVDLMSGESTWLAKTGGGCSGPRIGRYTVCAAEAARLGVSALKRAMDQADVIGIDEVGPMELLVAELRRAIIEAARSAKPLLAVAHAKLRTRDPEVYRLLVRGAQVIEVTIENRDSLQARAPEFADQLASAAGCGRRGA